MRNLTMLTDFYQLTMMQGYFNQGEQKRRAVFDMFFRPLNTTNFGVAAGLETALSYIQNLKFSASDIKYLRGLGCFTEPFLEYLSNFRFTGDIRAVPEGSVIFPGEPIISVNAPILEAQFVETALLNIISHQTLIATKAARIVLTAGDKPVVEFGARRAQGPDAGIYGARSAIIGGCVGTSNVFAGERWGLSVKGTHSHSWVLSFDTELEAFRAYAKDFPENCLLLVDSYNTLKSGVPNAITVFDELKSKGYTPLGIRLDSGDLAYLSKTARKMLDDAGHSDAKIFASGDIDEDLILHLNAQDAAIDIYGVGNKLITSDKQPSLGGVYKIAAIEEGGVMKPKMKLSDSVQKMTNPGEKEVFRLYDKSNGKAIADLIALKGEEIGKPLVLTHPTERWKQMTLDDYDCKKILIPVVVGGDVVYKTPELYKIADHCKHELDTFWPEYKRIINPHIYKVNLSDGLYDLKQKLLREKKG